MAIVKTSVKIYTDAVAGNTFFLDTNALRDNLFATGQIDFDTLGLTTTKGDKRKLVSSIVNDGEQISLSLKSGTVADGVRESAALKINAFTFEGPVDYEYGVKSTQVAEISVSIVGGAKTTEVNTVAEDGAFFIKAQIDDKEFHGSNSADRIYGSTGNDKLYADKGDDYVNAGAGDDTVWGGDGNDWLFGDAGNDTVYGEKGNDALDGYDGNDELNGGLGNDSLNGDVGNDILNGDDGNDWLLGGYDDDQLNGGTGDDRLEGGQGNDTLDGGADNDVLFGGSGNDSLIGGAGGDTLDGGAGNDKLDGGDGNDSLAGGDGEDSLTGGKGNDSLDGGKGNDTLIGGNDADTVHGGFGDDSIQGNGSNDVLYGDGGPEGYSVNGGNDIIYGGDGDDKLYGQVGNDHLIGGNGKDELRGGDGNDVLDGQLGDDLLIGNSGDDTFILHNDGSFDFVFDYSNTPAVNGGTVERANPPPTADGKPTSPHTYIADEPSNQDKVDLTDFFKDNDDVTRETADQYIRLTDGTSKSLDQDYDGAFLEVSTDGDPDSWHQVAFLKGVHADDGNVQVQVNNHVFTLGDYSWMWA